jgi:hypothetical protein
VVICRAPSKRRASTAAALMKSSPLVLNVLASVSQWEREAIGERTATAMQHKASQGEYTGGQAPYGRRVAPDGERLENDCRRVPGTRPGSCAHRDCRCAVSRWSWRGATCGAERGEGLRRCR